MNGPPYSTPPTAPAGRLAAWQHEQEERRRHTAAGQMEALRAAGRAFRDAVFGALGLRRL